MFVFLTCSCRGRWMQEALLLHQSERLLHKSRQMPSFIVTGIAGMARYDLLVGPVGGLIFDDFCLLNCLWCLWHGEDYGAAFKLCTGMSQPYSLTALWLVPLVTVIWPRLRFSRANWDGSNDGLNLKNLRSCKRTWLKWRWIRINSDSAINSSIHRSIWDWLWSHTQFRQNLLVQSMVKDTPDIWSLCQCRWILARISRRCREVTFSVLEPEFLWSNLMQLDHDLFDQCALKLELHE